MTTADWRHETRRPCPAQAPLAAAVSCAFPRRRRPPTRRTECRWCRTQSHPRWAPGTGAGREGSPSCCEASARHGNEQRRPTTSWPSFCCVVEHLHHSTRPCRRWRAADSVLRRRGRLLPRWLAHGPPEQAPPSTWPARRSSAFLTSTRDRVRRLLRHAGFVASSAFPAVRAGPRRG